MTLTYRTTTARTDALAAFPLLWSLSDTYPGFRRWYGHRVMPDLAAGAGFLMLAEDDGAIVGATIGKRGPETKLRCIRVEAAYRGRGIGHHLIERTLVELGCDRPLVTVPEAMIHAFARPFVNDFGFVLSEVEKGPYMPGQLEYVFNRAA